MPDQPDAPAAPAAPTDALPATQPLARPASKTELFTAFSLLALQGFGGVLAVTQRELCEKRRWVSPADFVQMLGNAQILPGPNVCNLSLMVGDRFFGWRGALVALAGMVTAPLVLVIGVAWLLSVTVGEGAAQQALRGALGGIAAVAAGQIVGTVLKLAAPLREHVLGLGVVVPLVAAAFLLMTVLHWPLLWVLAGLGGTACGLAWHLLGKPGRTA
jgi:chromate transporter